MLCPLAALLAKQSNATAIFDDLEAVAVQLELVEPLLSHRGGLACDRLAWANELWHFDHAQNSEPNHTLFMTSSYPMEA